jgi:hypothetical protein
MHNFFGERFMTEILLVWRTAAGWRTTDEDASESRSLMFFNVCR